MPDPAPDGEARPSSIVGELLARCLFPPSGSAVVCAVSGGADSLSLLVLACEAGLDVMAVHVDHGLRAGSSAEALVVEDAAERFGASFRSARVDVADGPDLEARARQARHSALGPGALTGHTADDQAETLLINLLRGAGITGMSAMQPGNTHPLLRLRRAETEALCAELGLVPVVDPTNQDPRFVRNRVRHEVLPLLASITDRDPVPLLARSTDQARLADEALKSLARAIDPSDTRALDAALPAVAATALRLWLTDQDGHPPSAAELDRVFAVVRHERTACELSGGRRIARSAGVLRIECADS